MLVLNVDSLVFAPLAEILRQPVLRLVTELRQPDDLAADSSGYGGLVLGT
jgi:hypothetical protein